MATFKTHLTVAATFSAGLAGGFFITDLATAKTAFFYSLLGSLGGILPDLDSPRSIPAQLLFNVLGILFATLVIVNSSFFGIVQYSWLVGGLIYVITYYGLAKLMAKFTVHRGNFHSVLAALWFGLATTAGVYHLLAARELVAWTAGAYVMLGYLIHLGLDEIYSIDFRNRKIKNSLGSALKIVSLRHKKSSIFLMVATIGIFLLTPKISSVINFFMY